MLQKIGRLNHEVAAQILVQHPENFIGHEKVHGAYTCGERECQQSNIIGLSFLDLPKYQENTYHLPKRIHIYNI